jgi:hypothetical protein
MRAQRSLAGQENSGAVGNHTAAAAKRPTLRLAPRPDNRESPEKYHHLDLRRRRAQIRARRALGLT